MPNFYNEGYMKVRHGWFCFQTTKLLISLQDGLAGKMNSLARSNASLYGNKEELYDRLKRHAYQPGQGKKGAL